MTRIPEPIPFDLAVDDNGDAYFVVDCPRCEQHSRHPMTTFRPGDPLSCSCGAVIATLTAGNLETMEDRLAGILGTLEESR